MIWFEPDLHFFFGDEYKHKRRYLSIQYWDAGAKEAIQRYKMIWRSIPVTDTLILWICNKCQIREEKHFILLHLLWMGLCGNWTRIEHCLEQCDNNDRPETFAKKHVHDTKERTTRKKKIKVNNRPLECSLVLRSGLIWSLNFVNRLFWGCSSVQCLNDNKVSFDIFIYLSSILKYPVGLNFHLTSFDSSIRMSKY